MKNQTVAIYRDLHDPIEDVHQAVVDGMPTKDVDKNIHMMVLLDRKDSSGSSYSPLYWAERVYQALHGGFFKSPQEAWDSIKIQAKGKGLSERQEKDILRWLGAMGFGVEGSEEALKKHSIADGAGYSVLDYKQKQVQAGLSVASKAITSLGDLKKNSDALKLAGSYFSKYNANKNLWKTKVRIAELKDNGFSDKEILKSCTGEELPRSVVIAELIRTATMEIGPKFRIEVQDEDGSIDKHYLVAESDAKARAQVKELYSGTIKVLTVEKVSEGQEPKEKQEEEGKKGLVEKKASLTSLTKHSKIGNARFLLASGESEESCIQKLEGFYPETERVDLIFAARTAARLEAGFKSGEEQKEFPADPFLRFYMAECLVPEDQAFSELRELGAKARRAMTEDFNSNKHLFLVDNDFIQKKAQAIPPMPTTDPGANKKWVWDPKQKSWVATGTMPGVV